MSAYSFDRINKAIAISGQLDPIALYSQSQDWASENMDCEAPLRAELEDGSVSLFVHPGWRLVFSDRPLQQESNE